MAAQSNPITISKWQSGVASSPYVGFGKMVGMEIFRKPGVIQPGVRLDLEILQSSVLTALPTASIGGFVGCADGKLFNNTTLIHTASAAIHDLAIVTDTVTHKQYLMITKADLTIDMYGSLDLINPTYTPNWVGGMELSLRGYKKIVVGQDDVIYIGNETKLASIVGFQFSSPAVNYSCLSTGMPDGDIVQSICELNRYIVIAVTTTTNARIYFMDRGILNGNQTSFSLSIGVDVPELIVNQLITQNNVLYYFGCSTGTIYRGNITSYTPVAVIPDRLPMQSYLTFPNAVQILNNEILFGIGGSHNPAYDTIYGLYSLRGNSLMIKNVISSNEYGQTTNVTIGSVYTVQNGSYQVTWQTGSASFGVDIGSSNLYTGFNCWIESPLYEVGSSIQPRTFQTVQFNLGNTLLAGQGFKLWYRASVNAPWTYFATYAFDGTNMNITYPNAPATSAPPKTKTGFHSNFPVTFNENIQVKVAFDTGSAVYGTNIDLKSIILI